MSFVVGASYKMQTADGNITGTFVSEQDEMATFFPWLAEGQEGTNRDQLTINTERIISLHRLA